MEELMGIRTSKGVRLLKGKEIKLMVRDVMYGCGLEKLARFEILDP